MDKKIDTNWQITLPQQKSLPTKGEYAKHIEDLLNATADQFGFVETKNAIAHKNYIEFHFMWGEIRYTHVVIPKVVENIDKWNQEFIPWCSGYGALSHLGLKKSSRGGRGLAVDKFFDYLIYCKDDRFHCVYDATYYLHQIGDGWCGCSVKIVYQDGPNVVNDICNVNHLG